MKLINLVGQKFGRWSVIGPPERVRSGRRVRVFWPSRCDCGTERLVQGDHLHSGASTSCGCIQREKIGALRRTHGLSQTRAYSVWNAMMQRCFNPNDRWYPDYGGRGITVCKYYCDFMNWRADWGNQPDGMSIDRIDNNGNYEPGNIQWATPAMQNANRRPPKRKARRAKLDDIRAFADALVRAASAPGGTEVAP